MEEFHCVARIMRSLAHRTRIVDEDAGETGNLAAARASWSRPDQRSPMQSVSYRPYRMVRPLQLARLSADSSPKALAATSPFRRKARSPRGENIGLRRRGPTLCDSFRLLRPAHQRTSPSKSRAMPGAHNKKAG
jgi:hypothetical protein